MVGVRLSSIGAMMVVIGNCLVSSGCFSPNPSFPQGGGSMVSPGDCPGCARAGGMMRASYQQPADGDPRTGSGVTRASYQQPGDGGPMAGPNMAGPNMGGPNMGGPNMGGPNMGDPGMVGPGGPGMIAGGQPYGPMPGELKMTSLQPYTVAPPDILFIDTIRMIPRSYRVDPLEVLLISVTNTIPNQDIKGPYTVGPDGRVALGFGYGSVQVGGMTLEGAAEAIQRHLKLQLALNPQVSVSLAQFRGMQQVRGEHLVRPDGTITLGTYGSVYVAGMTLGQIKTVVQQHLMNYVLDPQVSVDVFAYNSKVYYVIFDGAGYGMQVIRLPITGNETVLDAVSRVNGLAAVASKRRIWLARPSPANAGFNQIMPIDWTAITMSGSTATNWQIFPGDRIYVDSNWLIYINNRLSQVLQPVNQVMGTFFLGINTALGLQSLNNGTGFSGAVIR